MNFVTVGGAKGKAVTGGRGGGGGGGGMQRDVIFRIGDWLIIGRLHRGRLLVPEPDFRELLAMELLTRSQLNCSKAIYV